MSRNGTGTYNLPAGNPVVTGTTISSTWANNTLTDIANALSGSVAADGQTPMTGQLDMNSNKIKNLIAGTAAGQAVEFAQFTTPTFTGDVTMLSTGYVLIPKGTTAERPLVPVAGEIRYNTDYGQYEGYYASGWSQIGGGATGGGGDQVFVENGVTVTTNYTLSTNKNAESVGPITVNSGVTVTVPSNQRWVIL
jgi:hypothetical protein